MQTAGRLPRSTRACRTLSALLDPHASLVTARRRSLPTAEQRKSRGPHDTNDLEKPKKESVK
jgi:hypothetical protein